MPERLHGRPWAITMDAYEAIVALVESGKIDASMFADADGEGADLEVIDSVAVIRVAGALQKERTRYYFWLERESTYAQIREQVEAALGDSGVKAICFKVGSPGGDVDGVKELSDFLHRAALEKPIYAYADGQMCSAAYWLASVAKEIAAPSTAQVGSIGVRAMHVDRSKAQEKYGYKITYLTAGKYKAMGNPSEPLDEESTAYLLHPLNQIYTIFIDDVARNRGVSTDKALAMADGKVFLAQEALEIGLIDRVEESFDTFLTRIKEKEEVFVMEYGEFQAKHPDLYTKAVSEGREAAQKDVTDQVKAESERIMGIVSAVVGEEQGTKLTALVSSGATVAQIEAFGQMLGTPGATTEQEETDADGKDKASRQAILNGLQSAHSDGVRPEAGADKLTTVDVDKQAAALAALV
ncbi:S49 family peptidase [Desulfoluna butyratoxydans]|uniref:Peptidase s49 n=1 Tax=Desulfoluna butyratoxydans TaxID=231438 RepID=A0A4U8YZ54_9BACT|nr:S49 family peptidase [Desulfoluna butyratoxydans]VFQ46903.1 peptidase s49 [Desulfoluna butyratoxydans]